MSSEEPLSKVGGATTDEGGGDSVVKEDNASASQQQQETKPPPTKLIPSGVVCLRGNLMQETKDDTSSIQTRITGLWSMGLDKILADPENTKGECSGFEYQHEQSKIMSAEEESSSSAIVTGVYPPSGTYSGSFMVNTAGVKSKVEETDVALVFVENSEGFHNVEGKGSNIWGKFTITGTLSKEGEITLFRHYPMVVVQTSKTKTKRESVPQVKPPPTKLIPTGVICLRGKLEKTTTDNATVHTITGLWSMGLDKILDDPDNVKGECNNFEYEHKTSGESTAFPLSGKYTGSFLVKAPQGGGTNTKVEERNVMLKFRENNEGYHNVEGKGSNIWGKFTITGSLSKEHEITLFRHYQTLTQPGAAKPKKETVPQVKPPPTKLIPTGVVCLRGKLVRNTSQDLSLDDTAVHKITGLWSMGLDKILADPDNIKGECNNFEYEHKTSGGSTAFPLSGKYTGSFMVNDPQGGTKTKIDERNVMLKFRENNEGYHNVEGKGSNVWGKYSITGALDKEGVITLFRHYQAVTQPKKKAKKVAAAQKKQAQKTGTAGGTSVKPQTPNKNFTPTNPDTAAGEYLLERLRILLNRLQTSADILQNWPETQGDSSKVHADTGKELIASIRKIVTGLRSVERHVNGTGPSPAANIPAAALDKFRTSIDEKCPIPLDLLDLLDIGQPFGINPQCYARGLMKEAMRQLTGLERRKKALAMLGDAIEKGLNDRTNTTTTTYDGVVEMESKSAATIATVANKRKRDGSTEEADDVADTSKKMRIE